MSSYISQGLNKPVAYADVNPMSIQAMDMISKMFTGQGYTQPSYSYSAAGGGPAARGSGVPGIAVQAQNYQQPQPQAQQQPWEQFAKGRFYGGR